MEDDDLLGPNVPERPFAYANKRHTVLGIGSKSRKAKHNLPNTVAELWVDLDHDVDLINRGFAEVRPNREYAISGRIYRVKVTGEIYPVSGSGLHQLSGAQYYLLANYRSGKPVVVIERIIERHGIPAEDVRLVERLWRMSLED